jgi:hypothetical protein
MKVRKVNVDGGVALKSYQCLHVQVADLSIGCIQRNLELFLGCSVAEQSPENVPLIQKLAEDRNITFDLNIWWSKNEFTLKCL